MTDTIMTRTERESASFKDNPTSATATLTRGVRCRSSERTQRNLYPAPMMSAKEWSARYLL